MKIIRNCTTIIGAIMIIQLLFSCQDFLDAKPVSSLAVPNKLQDLQAILDNETRINQGYLFAGDLASDYFYLNDADFNLLNTSVDAHNIYRWKPDVNTDQDWRNYLKIFDVNVVLEQVDQAELGKLTEVDRQQIKGAALFFRGWTFFHLAQIFTPPYDPQSVDQLLGIPLKLSPNIEDPTQRSTLNETYRQIIEDLSNAADLLPISVPIATRPSKAAAYAALARVYLIMGDYQNSLEYANAALDLNSELLDFNELNPNAAKPIVVLNKEVLLHAQIDNGGGGFLNTRAKVNPLLFNLYDDADLRKYIYYQQNTDSTFRFKGDYGTNPGIPFAGLAVNELYITKAESLAWLGNDVAALESLNILLENRFKRDDFIPYTVENVTDILSLIITERYKELAFRAGIRWSDLRRLNKYPKFAKTLTREIGGEIFTLPPNDPRYTFLIPVSVVQLTGIEQNFRD